MTDEQILSYLGFESRSELFKRESIENIRAVVDIRAGAIVEEIMTDAQFEEFERLQAQGDRQVIWDWLRESVLGADMKEVYEATLLSYLDELKEQYAAIEKTRSTL